MSQMIQFNLLPDVKLEYIKTRRTKRLVIGGSLLLSALALIILIFLLFTVYVFQKKNMSDLNKDIKSYSSQLEKVPDLNKILTIQNQLTSLPALHEQKVAGTRAYGYIQDLTPATATISDLKIDYTQKTITITGEAPALDVVNTFTDTLKFTKYTVTDSQEAAKAAFSNVVLTSFSRDTSNATYTITTGYDETIFSNKSDVKLTVPKIFSTRSEIGQPTDLFKNSTTGTSGARQ